MLETAIRFDTKRCLRLSDSQTDGGKRQDVQKRPGLSVCEHISSDTNMSGRQYSFPPPPPYRQSPHGYENSPTRPRLLAEGLAAGPCKNRARTVSELHNLREFQESRGARAAYEGELGYVSGHEKLKSKVRAAQAEAEERLQELDVEKSDYEHLWSKHKKLRARKDEIALESALRAEDADRLRIQIHELQSDQQRQKVREQKYKAQVAQLKKQFGDLRDEPDGRSHGSNKRKRTSSAKTTKASVTSGQDVVDLTESGDEPAVNDSTRAQEAKIVARPPPRNTRALQPLLDSIRGRNQPLVPDGPEVAYEILLIREEIKECPARVTKPFHRCEWLAENLPVYFTQEGKLRWLCILNFEMNNTELFTLEEWALMVDDLSPHRRSDDSCWRDVLPNKESEDDSDGPHSSSSGIGDDEEDGAEPTKAAGLHKPTESYSPARDTDEHEKDVARPDKSAGSEKPADSDQPADSAKGAATAKPADQTTPTNSAESAQPAEIAEPAGSARPTSSPKTTKPLRSTAPTKTAEPVAPATLLTPAGSAQHPSENIRPTKSDSSKGQGKKSSKKVGDTDDLQPERADVKAGNKRGAGHSAVPGKHTKTIVVVPASSVNIDDEGDDANGSEKEEARVAFGPDNDDPDESRW